MSAGFWSKKIAIHDLYSLNRPAPGPAEFEVDRRCSRPSPFEPSGRAAMYSERRVFFHARDALPWLGEGPADARRLRGTGTHAGARQIERGHALAGGDRRLALPAGLANSRRVPSSNNIPTYVTNHF